MFITKDSKKKVHVSVDREYVSSLAHKYHRCSFITELMSLDVNSKMSIAMEILVYAFYAIQIIFRSQFKNINQKYGIDATIDLMTKAISFDEV